MARMSSAWIKFGPAVVGRASPNTSSGSAAAEASPAVPAVERSGHLGIDDQRPSAVFIWTFDFNLHYDIKLRKIYE